MEEGRKSILCVYSQTNQGFCRKRFSQVNIAIFSSCRESGKKFCLEFYESTLQQSLFSSTPIEICYQCAYFLCAFLKNPTIIPTAMRVSLCTLPNVMQIWRKHEIGILFDMSITLKERTLYIYENRGITNRISLNIQCVFFIEATQTASKLFSEIFQHKSFEA